MYACMPGLEENMANARAALDSVANELGQEDTYTTDLRGAFVKADLEKRFQEWVISNASCFPEAVARELFLVSLAN